MVLLAGCTTTSTQAYRSAYASDSPMPKWIGRIYWTDNNFMYAVGGIIVKDADDFSASLRIAEINAVKHMLHANGLCGGRITGKIPIESWVSPNGEMFMLVRAEKSIQGDECQP